MKPCVQRNKRLITIMIVLFILFLIWGLYFKFANYADLLKVFNRLGHLTLEERFLYDIKLFEFTGNVKRQQIEAILNVLVFVPLGVMLCIKDNGSKIVKHMLICFIVSLVIEVGQLFTKIGGFAFDDLICNTGGYLLAIPIYYLIFRHLSPKFEYYLYKTGNYILSGILGVAIVTTLITLPKVLALFS